MSVHTVVKKEGIYFITFTCHNWLPLIEQSNCYSAIYNFFTVLKGMGTPSLLM
jgi:hypothetical protein